MLIYVYVLVVFFLWFLLFVVHLMIFLMNYFSSYYRLVSFDFLSWIFSVHTRVLCHCRCCWRTSTQVWKICQTAKKQLKYCVVYCVYFLFCSIETNNRFSFDSIQLNLYMYINISTVFTILYIYVCVSLCVLFNPVSFVLSQTLHPYPLFPMIYTLPLLWFLVSNKNRQFFSVLFSIWIYIYYTIYGFFCLISVKKMIPQTWINWKLQI